MFQKKTNEPILRKLMDRRKDGQEDRWTLFCRTLPADAGGPIRRWRILTEAPGIKSLIRTPQVYLRHPADGRSLHGGTVYTHTHKYVSSKLVIERLPRTVWPIFSLFLLICFYFTRLNACEISKTDIIEKFWLYCPRNHKITNAC